MADTVVMDFKGLDQFVKALKGKLPVARVGILGETSRTDSKSNAEIGAAHEFGAPSKNIVMRSWLRVPLKTHLNTKLEQSKAFDPDVLAEVIKSGNIRLWMQKVAVIGEGIVIDAFKTSGDGTWRPWKDPKYKNNTGQLLLDTQGLRNAVSSDVKG